MKTKAIQQSICNDLSLGATFIEIAENYPKQTVSKDLHSSIQLCSKLEPQLGQFGLNNKDLFEMVYHIKHKVEKSKKNVYLRKEKSGLARTIEYNKKYKRTFIHLKRHNVQGLGNGAFKSATKSLLLEKNNSRLVANAVSKREERNEIDILKHIGKAKGFATFVAEGIHTSKKVPHVKKHSIITELCNMGSLGSNCGIQHLTLKDKINIATTGLKALKAMHDKGITHRDLHAGNILLHRPSPHALAEAKIIDFNGAVKTSFPTKKLCKKAFACLNEMQKQQIAQAKSDFNHLIGNLWKLHRNSIQPTSHEFQHLLRTAKTHMNSKKHKAQITDIFSKVLMKIACPQKKKHKSMSFWIGKLQKIQKKLP